MADEVRAAEVAFREAQEKLEMVRESESRKRAEKMFLERQLPSWSRDNQIIHYKDCKNVKKWLGDGYHGTPKESLKYFPVPPHKESPISCPGCMCEEWKKCLDKAKSS